MLTYNFTNIGSDFLYEYLYKCIKNDILQGRIRVGEKLPSKRSFAKNLGVSVMTVENAYEQLVAEGFIYAMPKRGFYVSSFKKSSAREKSSLPTAMISAIDGQSDFFADFTSNQTPSDLFPFTIWSKTVREVLADSRIQLMTNPPCGGILALRQAIANYLKDFRGMSVAPEQIIIGAGTEYLYGLLIQLLGRDKKYGVENPGYLKIAQIYQAHGVSCDWVGMDEKGISVDTLEEKGIDIIHCSPSHHFPTGIVTPISRRYELLGWASRKAGRYIIEDDYDSELRLSGKPIPTMQSIDVSERIIYMNTFTKTLSSTVRISYMVLPPDLLHTFMKELSFYSCTVSNFEQYTLARFIEEGKFEAHINRLRNHYRKKRQYFLRAIEESALGQRVEITGEDAGLHFLMQVHSTRTMEELIAGLKGEGVNLAPLADYDATGSDAFRHYYVMNDASLSEEAIPACIDLLEKWCK